MTETITLETKFVVPDDMDEENVRHVLGQFFGDLVRTDRFVDARILDKSTMDEADKERVIELLEDISSGEIEQLEPFIEEYTG